MIVFRYDKDKTFEVCAGWKDVTLKMFLDFFKEVEAKMPRVIKDIHTAETEEERDKLISEITLDQEVQILEYQLRYICHFSNLTYEDAHRIKREQIRALYAQLSKWLSVIPKTEYVNVIEHDGENWYLPERYMKDSTFGEFVESASFEKQADRLKKGDWAAMPAILCVLLRKKKNGKREEYTKELQLRRSRFLRLKMHKVFHVAFFLMKLNERFGLNSIVFTKAQQVAHLKRKYTSKKTMAGT